MEAAIQHTVSDHQQPTEQYNEADFTFQLQHTKATLEKSISEIVAATDDLGLKYDRLENNVDEDLSVIRSKLTKVSRAQGQQVSTIMYPLDELTLIFCPTQNQRIEIHVCSVEIFSMIFTFRKG